MSKLRPIEEMEKELEDKGCTVVALVGASKLGEYILPGDLEIAWGMGGVWDIVFDFAIRVKLPKKHRKVRTSNV